MIMFLAYFAGAENGTAPATDEPMADAPPAAPAGDF